MLARRTVNLTDVHMGYMLRHHVFGCIASERIVLLDLMADRYFCAPPKAEAAIKMLLDKRAMGANDRASLTPLVSKGLLVETNTPGLSLTEINLLKARGSVFDFEKPRVNAASLSRSISNRIMSEIAFKMWSVHLIVDRLSARKKNMISNTDKFSEFDISSMVWPFIASRRFISKQDKCLSWSIAMVNYLSRFYFYPDLVIGVKMNPFSAHAWVQYEGLVLSDTVESVLPYTPILIV